MPNHISAQASAQANAEAALRAQAMRTAVFLIKHRARAYAKRPMTLETISPGLTAAAPDTWLPSRNS
jgi:hypothetical protein